MQQPNWKSILTEILRDHNERHGKRDKVVSNLTMQHRKRRLFNCFQQLRDLGYRLENPRNLSTRHIEVLVRHWVSRGLTPATIQTWLSHLRVFSAWIGKPGMVRAPSAYVSNPASVQRDYAAGEDGSWSSRSVDIEAIFHEAAAVDTYVGNQLIAELLFGLRVKEAIMLRPWRDDAGESLMVVDGTKGGRARVVPIVHPEQRQALDAFKLQLQHKRASLADPRLRLHQAIHRYYSVMRRVGINKKHLGVTSHGLRREFANRRYREIAGVASPVQGGKAIGREHDRQARVAVMEMLGHNREQIGSAYLGAILRTMKQSGRLDNG